jgi:hypothetical protein
MTLKLSYASDRRAPRCAWRRSLAICLLTIFVYVGSYAIVRSHIGPAANLAFFVYSDNGVVDSVCYYAFLPLYKVDRWLTGRKHNLDRTPIVLKDEL